jgi:L-iditol 2-dehydrogenase
VSTAAIPAIKQAFMSVDNGGKVLLFASTHPSFDLPININNLWSNQQTIITSYAAAPRDILASIEIIRSGRIKVQEMITHKFKLAEIKKGFRLVARAEESMKVVIEPHK